MKFGNNRLTGITGGVETLKLVPLLVPQKELEYVME
jgi:hypothetical protein